MIKKIALAFVILIIVAFVTVYFVRNTLVEKAVESGSAYVLDVNTDLGSAGLELGGGSLELNDFEISNPEGFTSDNFLTLRHGLIDVQAGSVLDDEVVVDSFIIEGVTLNLEQIDSKGNYKILLDNMKKFDQSSSEESSKFRIGLIAFRDINVNSSLSLLGNKVDKSFKLDNFTLKNVGNDNGATISELTSTVVKSLISKALSSGGSQLPEGFGTNLNELKDQTVDKIKTDAADKLKDLGKSITGGN